MVRKRPQERLRDFVLAATEVFLAKGYRRAQMSDVTAALELSPGSIYRYFESKEALFDAVLRHAVDGEFPATDAALPVPAPPREATLVYLGEQIARRTQLPRLEAALATRLPGDPFRELEDVILEVYRSLHHHRVALNLVERCALDWPEMAELWFEKGRPTVIKRVAQYLARRAEDEIFHPVPEPMAAARLFIEVVSFLAVHRHDDPYPVEMTPQVAETLALNTLLRLHLRPGHLASHPEPESGAASRSRR